MERGTLLIAECSVEYNGRASSFMDKGEYLVIYKNDGSLAIHGSDKIIPRNYLSNNSTLTKDGNKFTWTKKKESITLIIDNIKQVVPLSLSDSQPVKRNTEKELVDKLIANWANYTGLSNKPTKEKKTEHGPIDLYSHENDTHHIIEAKRKTITIKDVTQVLRYGETFAPERTQHYIAGPGISKNALKYAMSHNVTYIHVSFEN